MASFIHCMETHGSIITSHVLPVKPVRQEHVNPLDWLVHTPFGLHGSPEQKSITTSQEKPVNPSSQLQKKELVLSIIHVPLLPQGLGSHISMSTSQSVPINPSGHMHMNPSIRSRHVPLLRHGVGSQLSMSTSHISPVNPSSQIQL